MARRLPVSLNYGTHMPALMRAMALTDGGVLELGMGLFSTPYLHYACVLARRQLVSYETDPGWAKIFIDQGYNAGYHAIRIIENWNVPDLRGLWSVALIDHSPGKRRIVEISRLAEHVEYIVVHDVNGRYESEYHYSEIYPLFRWRTDWTADHTHTAVLSNFHDLKDFWRKL